MNTSHPAAHDAGHRHHSLQGHRSSGHARPAPRSDSLNRNRTALFATLHRLTGCAIGEVPGLMIGTALGWGTPETIGLAVTLAFLFGYAFTMVPLLRAGLPARAALRLALAADTASIAVMEVTDNAVMLAVPGAMQAGLDSMVFWASLAAALLVAAVIAFPVNRWLIARGRGHAVAHAMHGHPPQAGHIETSA
jgi:hypothetical protein